MSSRRDIPGDEPIEHDPTGMRALLSSLPDPGPMPAGLVERISASLLAERTRDVQPHAGQSSRSVADGAQAGKGHAGKDPSGEHHEHAVVPLGHRRLGWRPLAAAVAGIAVIGVGVSALITGTSPSDVAATLRGHGGGSAESAAGSAASMSARSSQSGSSRALTLPAAGTVSIHLTGHRYDSKNLGTQAAQLLRGTLPTVAPLGAEVPSIGPIATKVGLRGCAAALGLEPTAGIAVDVATVDGTPAAVLVVSQGAHPTAYAVERTCTAGRPDLIAGPVPVP